MFKYLPIYELIHLYVDIFAAKNKRKNRFFAKRYNVLLLINTHPLSEEIDIKT